MDENANVVRIMSIHKSKGLEFPVTFVSGLAKRFNMQDANQSLIVDVDLGTVRTSWIRCAVSAIKPCAAWCLPGR